MSEGIYKVIEDNCVRYHIASTHNRNAIDVVKRYLFETGETKEDLKKKNFTAERYNDKDVITIHIEEEPITLMAKEWYTVCCGFHLFDFIISCSEWD